MSMKNYQGYESRKNRRICWLETKVLELNNQVQDLTSKVESLTERLDDMLKYQPGSETVHELEHFYVVAEKLESNNSQI